jgi:hypothetical protein
MTKAETYKEQIKRMVDGARAELEYLIDEMPDAATTAGQRRLQEKHGTPRQFAKDVIQAIGEISVPAAEAAIKRYEREWDAA